MVINDLGEFLLKNFPSAEYASGKTEIVMKCPFCGDSKNIGSKHFYISMVKGKPHLYNCFKCNEKGILTSKVLKRMLVYDTDVLYALDKYNKSIIDDSNYQTYNYIRHNLYYKISKNELSDYKLKYINTRLGINLNYQDLESLKVCLNLNDILYDPRNNIKTLTRDPNIVNQLNKYFIGAISVDNNFVTMRNLAKPNVLYKSIDKRYITYNIFGMKDNSKRYYVVPGVIKLDKAIDIHIAEGFFDILSVYMNFIDRSSQNICAAINSKSYLNILTYFIAELGLFFARYHIYIDNDIDNWDLYNIKKLLNKFKVEAYIHRNIYPGEKDFGVKRNKIIDSVQDIRSI